MSTHPWELAWKEGRWFEASGPFPIVVEFARSLEKVGVRDVLDFGCGAGRHSLYLGKLGFRVVAFDISETALNLLKGRLTTERLTNVQAVESDMARLPFNGQSFDAVIGNNVLHHANKADINHSIGEVHRVLRDRAWGLMSVLSVNDHKYGRGELVEAGTYLSTAGEETGIIHHFFSREELVKCFSGFRIVSLKEEIVPSQNGNRAHHHIEFEKCVMRKTEN